MKVNCDLCGGTLLMNLGGQGATCMSCGLGYEMARLREKLKDPDARETGEKTKKTNADTGVQPVEMSVHDADFEPKQFVMENSGCGIGDLSGRVQQGGIGIGDKVYFDGDYEHPYRINCINDDAYATCAKEGMPAELFLTKCPKRILKKVRVVTGDPNPVVNAYNFPGTVRQFFYHLLLRQFPEYEIRMDVPHEELTIPVSYMLMRGEKPVVAVFVIDGHHKSRYQAEKAAGIFEAEGVGCTHFFENYRNDMPYVIERVRAALPERKKETLHQKRSEVVSTREPVVLDVISVKRRPGFAWGMAKCHVRKGVVETGVPCYAHINTMEGEKIQLGSMQPVDIAAGSEVTMILYCEKELLSSIRILYVFPFEEDEEDEV